MHKFLHVPFFQKDERTPTPQGQGARPGWCVLLVLHGSSIAFVVMAEL